MRNWLCRSVWNGPKSSAVIMQNQWILQNSTDELGKFRKLDFYGFYGLTAAFIGHVQL